MDSKSLLTDGLADAVGFAGGSQLAFWLGRLLGLSISDAGYGNSTIFGIKLGGPERRFEFTNCAPRENPTIRKAGKRHRIRQ